MMVAVMAGVVALAACGSSKTTGSKGLKVTAPTTSTSVATTLPNTTTTVASTTSPSSTTVAKPKTTTPTTKSVTTTSTPGSTGAPLIQLTSASSGSFAVSVGQSVELTLSDSGIDWGSVMVAPTGLLAPDPSPSPPAHGQLAIWTAVAKGTVTITADGPALCSVGVACPQFVRLFKVTLVIS